jgi:hypothetical protein
VRAEQSVRVQCLRCGHVGVLTAETLSRLAITPSTPLLPSSNACAAAAAAVQNVLATRKPDLAGYLHRSCSCSNTAFNF